MRQLTELTTRLAEALDDAGVPYRVEGGFAIYLHSIAAAARLPSVRQSVDIAFSVKHWPRLEKVLQDLGLDAEPDGPGRLVRVHSQEPFDGGGIHLFSTDGSGLESAVRLNGIQVARIADLVRDALDRFTLEGRLYLKNMDRADFITPEIEAGLSDLFRARLAEIRATE